MDDNIIPVHDKCMVISAITMNILHRFDSTKIEFMLDLCRRPEPELAARAITGLIPVFQIYNSRMELYSELGNRLKLLSDDKMFNRRFIAAIIGFIQAHETEKITKKTYGGDYSGNDETESHDRQKDQTRRVDGRNRVR